MSPEEVKARLREHFPDAQIEVRDLTGTEDHYQVSVVSSVFENLTRIASHQKVMAALGPELKTGEVHALSIQTGVPKSM
jgi:stress-induced morphogen